MSRPGFVLEVDERTPPLLLHAGESFRLQEFPLGTRVVYPLESLPGVPDVDEEIEHAMLHPLDSEPLPALLTRQSSRPNCAAALPRPAPLVSMPMPPPMWCAPDGA